MAITIGYVVATAYSNQRAPIKIKPESVDAVSNVVNYGVAGKNLKPVEAVALSVTSATPIRPTVAGEQLQFFWG